MPTPAELLSQSLAALRDANRVDGTRASYRKDNPGEFVSVMAYLDGGPRPNLQLSLMGQGLVLEEDARRALAPAPPPPPPPPPTGSKLSWAPPTLSNPVQWTMTNANRQSGSLLSGGGRDLLITSGEVLTGPVQQLNNWRHIVWIGLEINIPSGDNFALPLSQTGTAHIEGPHIHGAGVSDGIVTRGGAPDAVVQIQNARIEVDYKGGEHADCFQTQGNTKLESLRFDRVTMVTDYQGIFLRLSPQSAFLNGGDFRRLNFRRLNAGQDPQQAYLFVSDEDPETGHPPGAMIGNIAMTDVWAEGSHSGKSSIFYPSWIWETALANPSLGAFGNKEGLFKETDAQGHYVRPSTTADRVPSGGSASGQQAESAGWTGIIRLGIPPGGDFCPSSVPGVGYDSPGYL